MTERQCPLCHIHAIQSPHGQCANANCPPFEGWPEPGAISDISAPIPADFYREAEPSPAPLVEVETVDDGTALGHSDPVDNSDSDVSGGLRPVYSGGLLPKVGGTVDGNGNIGASDAGRPSGDGAADPRSPSLRLLPALGAIVPAPQPIRTLGETLGNILKAATERADKLAAKVQASSDELHKVMDATEEVSQDMDRVTADMKTKLGLGGNGGPSL